MTRTDTATEPLGMWRRVFEYYVFVYAVSYGLVGLFFAGGGNFADASWVFFAQVSALSPALVAMLYTRVRLKEKVVAHMAMRPRWNRWLFVSWLLAPVIACLALGLGLLIPGTYFDGTLQPAVARTLLSPEQVGMLDEYAQAMGLPLVLLLIPMGMVLSVTMSLVAGCGEELGWRGFVHSELRPLGFWRNTLLTALLWLLWHLPLLALGYGFPDHPLLGVGLMSIECPLFSIIASYLREMSSAFGAGLFHGATEAFMLLAIAPVGGGSELTVGMASISWIGAVALVAAGLVLFDRFVSGTPVIFTAK